MLVNDDGDVNVENDDDEEVEVNILKNGHPII